MNKIKKYWMPAIAALFVIAGLSDFSLVTILLGAGIGYVWWKDVRESSAVDKKSVTFKIARWLLAGIGCDMLFHGDASGGIVLLVIDILWAAGVFKKMHMPKVPSMKSSPKSKSHGDDGQLSLEQACDKLLKKLWCSGRVAATAPSEWGTAMYYEHKITRIDVFPYSVLRLKMLTEKHESKKTACDVGKAKANMPVEQIVGAKTVSDDSAGVTYIIEECSHCHGAKELKCPTCHGDRTHWDCPDCHGEAGHLYKCPACEGKGETVCTDCDGEGESECPDCHGTGVVACHACNGEGWVEEEYKETCARCNGTGDDGMGTHGCAACWDKGYHVRTRRVACVICNGEGYHKHNPGEVTCPRCQGERTISCDTCENTGHVVCDTCNGKGELGCKKCDSTGVEHCHTCGGHGMVTCPKCHGEGAFAYALAVAKERESHEVVVAWSDSDIPKAILPKLFLDYRKYADDKCKNVYHFESTAEIPDDRMVLSEEGMSFPKLKEAFDSLSRKIQCGENIRLLSQEADVETVNGLVRLEIKCAGKDWGEGSVFWSGKKVICWVNFATNELIDIYAENTSISDYQKKYSDSWYENNGLSKSQGSPYYLLERAKSERDPEKSLKLVKAAYDLGNPQAAYEYGLRLCEGKTPDKKKDKLNGQSALRDAEKLGMPHSKYLDA